MRSRVLTDDDLRDLAVAQGIPLEWAERDYLLVSIAAGLEEAFPGQLCFKGGFVLRHVYGHSRFSQDVDFDAAGTTPSQAGPSGRRRGHPGCWSSPVQGAESSRGNR